MYSIAETSMLVRGQIELPAGIRLTTQKFRKGWNFVASKDARLLEAEILDQGWNFIRVVDGWMRSSVGKTEQAAIGNALSLALRQVSPHFNAMDVGHIEATKYPRFFEASVMVNPYRIQSGEVVPVMDEALPSVTTLQPRLLPLDAAALFPNFSSAMPELKEMLLHSRDSQTSIH